tara:strand:+ start:805 stop:1215 length:411 start_codon:yes stop_codon:yes gene_type:complete
MQKTIEKENYLKILYKLEEKSQLATVTSLAKHFNVSKSTVSNMIKKLMFMRLVDSGPYKPILLTNTGKKTAIKVISKHRLIELYLYEKMQFELDEVHEIAEEIEHIKNIKFFKRIQKILGHKNIDPHGTIIPRCEF